MARYGPAPIDPAVRFDRQYVHGGADECWPWTGTLMPQGYGAFWDGHRNCRAHRFAVYGADHTGRPELDHLCHTRDESCAGGFSCLHRRCVNPAHLEPVTSRENTLRGKTAPAANVLKTTCPVGHPLDGRRGDGARYCTVCNRARQRARYTDGWRSPSRRMAGGER